MQGEAQGFHRVVNEGALLHTLFCSLQRCYPNITTIWCTYWLYKTNYIIIIIIKQHVYNWYPNITIIWCTYWLYKTNYIIIIIKQHVYNWYLWQIKLSISLSLYLRWPNLHLRSVTFYIIFCLKFISGFYRVCVTWQLLWHSTINLLLKYTSYLKIWLYKNLDILHI